MATFALVAASAVLLAAAEPAAAPPAPTMLAVDAETTVGGVAVGCTGIGQTKSDPKWAAYPVRIEFSNAAREYLQGGEIVIYDAASAPLLSVRCDAPWILLKLPAGSYRVEGRVPDSPAQPRSATFKPPAKGQMRLVLAFPDA
jgi:hypothetical protein